VVFLVDSPVGCIHLVQWQRTERLLMKLKGLFIQSCHKKTRSPAKGKDIWITGEVYDSAGIPVEDAMVEIWQANAEGRYSHPHDPNPAPRDQNFQGWAIVPSGTAGGFRFHTVMPGSYPAGPGWERPPHIHFKVMKRGFVELITQMYFPGHPLNETDRLLQRKTDEEQKLMVAEVLREQESNFHYRIVLERA